MPLKKEVVEVFRRNVDLFAWIAADMPRIYPKFMSDRLATFPSVRPIA